MNPLVQCPKCRAWLLEGALNQPELSPCPACGVPLRVEIFPAMFRKLTPGPAPELVMVEGESSCFYHPQKKAVRPCDSCGRFMCALCDCELGHDHFCPACLETGKSKGKIKSLESARTRYDSIALALAVYPMLFFYYTINTAGIALLFSLGTLFVAFFYWKSPISLTSRNRARMVIAMVLAALQIIGWVVAFIYLVTRNA